MKQKANIWLTPREAALKVKVALPYHKEVTVFNNQVDTVAGYRQSYHITVRISFFRSLFRLERTKKDLHQICERCMPYNIPYVYYIKAKRFGTMYNYESPIIIEMPDDK